MTLQLLEKDLNRRPTILSKLQPQFILIGSVAEGTNILKGIEADTTVKFLGLHEFQVRPDAFSLVVNELDREVLKEFISEEGKFDYAKFSTMFLREIRDSLEVLHNNGILPSSLEFDFIFKPCQKCHEKEATSIYQPQTHCENCRPAICHTKVGAGLFASWTIGEFNV